jgi:6-phospho-beta-glucosidase
MPETRAEDLQIIKENTVDLLGVNYYQPRRVQQKRSAKTADTPMPEDYFDVYDWPEKKINPHRGWEIYERGIYDTLINLRDNYGNIPCYISENGMGVEDETRFIDASGQIQDEYRITFIKDHLRYVHQAIQEGSRCRGYHMWTCMDNWSWLNEFKNRYGFIAVDLATQKRTIKKSGEWFREVIQQNGFVD